MPELSSDALALYLELRVFRFVTVSSIVDNFGWVALNELAQHRLIAGGSFRGSPDVVWLIDDIKV